MTTGDLVATLAVAFVGGGLGAITGPIITGRQGRRQREAERKAQPYETVIHAARNYSTAIRIMRYLPAEERLLEFSDVEGVLVDAVNRTDHVRSAAVERLIEELTDAAEDYMRAQAEERQGPGERNEAQEAAVARTEAAYRALREQVQRETRG